MQKRACTPFDDALFRQYEYRRLKQELSLEIKWTSAKNGFIVGIYFHQEYYSPRCWNTTEKVFKEYDRLGSKSKKLKAAREKIQLRYLGLGFKEEHHQWSKYCVTYSPTQMPTHLKTVVITLQLKKTITDEPPMEVPSIPNLPSFGTMQPYVVDIHNYSSNKVDNSKESAREEREKI